MLAVPSLVRWCSVRRVLIGALLTLLPAVAIFGQAAAPEPTTLALGQTVARDIKSGQKHSFTIQATAGQVVRGAVSQIGTDVIVRVFEEKGRWTSEFDSQLRYEGKEPFEFVADETGTFRIEVEGKRGTPDGSCQLTVASMEPAAERDNKIHKANTLMSVAAAQSRAGKLGDAITKGEEALKLREEVFGDDSVEVPILVNRIGIYYAISGNTTKALASFNRALAICNGLPDTDEVLKMEMLNNVAGQLRIQGNFSEAEAAFKKVIAVREKVFGPDAYILGPAFNNIGLLYRVRGDFEAAEQFYEKSLRVRERHLGEGDLELQTPLMNLAAVAFYKGDFVTALKIDERVLAIRQKGLTPGHPLIAEANYNLALVHSKMGQLDTAEKLILQAIPVYEKSYPPDSNQHFFNYSTLGNIYRELGDLARSREYMDRALRVSNLNQRGDPLTYAAALLYSARLRILENDLVTAEKELTEALSIRERVLGPDHIDTREVLSSFARLYTKTGNIPRAIESQARANAIGDRQLAVNLVFGTEHQRLSFASLLNTDLDHTLAMHAFVAPADSRLRDLSATALLQRKGRVLDATALSLTSMRRQVSPENAALLEQLSDATARLSALMLNGSRSDGPSYEKTFNELQTLKDSLDRELSRRSAGYYQPQKTYTVEQAKALIPANAALIEFARVNPTFAPGSKTGGKAEYVAYVIRPGSDVAYVKLGEAGKIDAAVAQFRKSLRDPSRSDTGNLGRQLDQLVFKPVRSLTGTATHILLSPEGELNVFPFEALVDETGSYAVQKFQFTYLTSGRDLFRLETSPKESESPVIVADPSFGSDGSALRASSRSQPVAVTRSITTGKEISEVYFGPLRGTAAEASYIKQLFPDARLLTGSNATVSAVRKLKAPRMLHLATHGFFLEDAAIQGKGYDADRTQSVSVRPLVRSGLALSGANLRNVGPEDGLLTALEASGLDLWGTKLTVLSACDTGVGEIRAGEGVYGLRRAFTLAGTQALVMSMWPVGDTVTRELMSKYYLNLRNGLGRGEALRQVRLELIKQRNRRHPYYWASFIQSGEWANLDGKR